MVAAGVIVGGIVLAIVALLFFLLSSPDRSLPADYFDQSRRFVLTGCASGIGRHLARCLLERGHRLVATDLQYEKLCEVAKEEDWEGIAARNAPAGSDKKATRVVLRKVNVMSRDEWAKAIEAAETTFGGVDVGANIAGFLRPARAQDMTERDIDLHVGANLLGVIHGTQLMAQSMIRSGNGGTIVNFSSLGAIAPVSGVTLYLATKFGCRGFSLAAAKDLEPENVHVCCVMPDAVQTPMCDLQLDYEESAMAFSGPSILTVQDIEREFFEVVLKRRPVEHLIPLSWGRGIGARLGDVFHSSRVIRLAEKLMRAKGIEEQKKRNSAS